jgi:hypothetical protein
MILSHSPTAVCPECAELITFQKEPPLHYLLLCPHCETILMVTAVAPLMLDWAFEEPLPAQEWFPYILNGSTYWQFHNRYR